MPEIRTLLTYFELGNVRWRKRNRPDPEMVFCFVLCKLSYPHRLFELADHFGYSPSYLSYVANDLIEYLVERYKSLLEWHPSLTYERMKEYAKAASNWEDYKERAQSGALWMRLSVRFVGQKTGSNLSIQNIGGVMVWNGLLV